jgi:hypothetical protein
MTNWRSATVISGALITALSSLWQSAEAQDVEGDIGLKEAKLIVEHNATDNDTGFQGFFDVDGWQRLVVTGPDGMVLTFEAEGGLGKLGMTELFFETVEPEEDEVPIVELLATLPEGEYRIDGEATEAGEGRGTLSGSALLTHTIPAGATLLAPVPGATVPVTGLVVSWSPVTQAMDGSSVNIVSYQLIVEKEEPPHPHLIGKRGLSIYLPPTVTSITLPDGILEPGSHYDWEVLAIEESGNQTISASSFSTE